MSKSFEIRREIDIEATPEEVWAAIATREGLRGWLWDQEVIPEAAARSVVEPPPPPAHRAAPGRERRDAGLRVRH